MQVAFASNVPDCYELYLGKSIPRQSESPPSPSFPDSVIVLKKTPRTNNASLIRTLVKATGNLSGSAAIGLPNNHPGRWIVSRAIFITFYEEISSTRSVSSSVWRFYKLAAIVELSIDLASRLRLVDHSEFKRSTWNDRPQLNQIGRDNLLLV